MSPPLFLVDALPAGDVCRLDGPEGHHAATVQRLRAGEPVLLGDGRGGLATAVVTASGQGTVDLAVTGRRQVPEPDPRIVVVQGIAKGDRSELAVQAMTEVGVDGIVPWAAERCVVVWRGARGVRAAQRWLATAREAAKQARRPWLPEVSPAALTTTGLVRRIQHGACALVLDAGATTRLATMDLPEGELTLVVGPEGGIAPDELAALTEAGAVAVRLGDTVLRTSTAGAAAIAVLAARLGRW